MTFIQDNRSTSTLNLDNRSSPATFNQDNKTIGAALWSSGNKPWTMSLPWLWAGNGQQIALDTRHVG